MVSLDPNSWRDIPRVRDPRWRCTGMRATHTMESAAARWPWLRRLRMYRGRVPSLARSMGGRKVGNPLSGTHHLDSAICTGIARISDATETLCTSDDAVSGRRRYWGVARLRCLRPRAASSADSARHGAGGSASGGLIAATWDKVRSSQLLAGLPA